MAGGYSPLQGRRGRVALWLALAAGAWVACHPGRIPATVRPLAPGVLYHELYVTDGPWAIRVVEIDVATAWQAGVRLRTARANPRVGGLEKTSLLARDALAAVNGDFFLLEEDRARPTGMQVSRGQLLCEPHRNSVFAVAADGTPLIDVFRLEMSLTTSAGAVLPVAAYNRAPAPAGLAFYSRLAENGQDSVRADVGLQIQSLGPPPAVGDTASGVVLQIRRQTWPLRLEEDQWLVAAGAHHEPAAAIAPGDTVRLSILVTPVNEPALKVEEAVGGGPRIVRDGAVSVEYARENLEEGFAAARHPRTAVGYTEDRGTVYLVTVDGRQPGYSVGMNLEELGRFLQSGIGEYAASRRNAYQAINLDGGGNTTMVVGQQVVNRPSDPTGERAVANALLVVAGEPRS